jgi:hypothetical protein
MVAPSHMSARVIRAIAKEWDVAPVTIEKWHGNGWPVHDQKALADVLVKAQTSMRVRARAQDILKGYEKEPGQDETVFQAEMKVRRNALEAVEDLERYQAYFKAEVEKGQRSGNDAMIENAIKRYAELSVVQVRVRKELHKMGEESGNTIAKSEASQIIDAMGSRASIGVGRLKEALAKVVAGAMTVEEAANRIEPELVRVLFFEPFKAASGVAAACGLPVWVVERLRKTLGDYVEDGEKEFDEREKSSV